LTAPGPGHRRQSVDHAQSAEYDFPYHYIPQDIRYPKLSRTWKYSHSYIAATRLCSHWLRNFVQNQSLGEHRHVDVGCGDGAFLKTLARPLEFQALRFHGIDQDPKAIAWAQLISSEASNLRFSNCALAELTPHSLATATLIEVLEHIPPAEADGFLAALADRLQPGGQLFLTVPSTENPLIPKHYRHFDFETLAQCFEGRLEIVELFGFAKQSALTFLFRKLFMRRKFYFESAPTTEYLIREAAKRHSELKGCKRIGLILRKHP
jgi:2-polyprenyl-3-methyl-5-hydroxy-6-metoxy-1,4-benzoquinol methylase